jgi:hypothetical protein
VTIAGDQFWLWHTVDNEGEFLDPRVMTLRQGRSFKVGAKADLKARLALEIPRRTGCLPWCGNGRTAVAQPAPSAEDRFLALTNHSPGQIMTGGKEPGLG